jgi:hypothetical protein
MAKQDGTRNLEYFSIPKISSPTVENVDAAVNYLIVFSHSKKW